MRNRTSRITVPAAPMVVKSVPHSICDILRVGLPELSTANTHIAAIAKNIGTSPNLIVEMARQPPKLGGQHNSSGPTFLSGTPT